MFHWNADFIFLDNFTGSHQATDATNTLQTTFLPPSAVGFVPVVTATETGFRLIANFNEAPDPLTQPSSSTSIQFTYVVQANDSFEITGETAAIDGATTQVSADNISAFDEHCYQFPGCIVLAPQIGFSTGSGFSSTPSINTVLSHPGIGNSDDFGNLAFTTQMTASALGGDNAVLNSASFLYDIVPLVPLPPLARLKYTEIQVPGAVTTLVSSMNDEGSIVGSFIDADGASHGFLQDNNGIHEIAVPYGTNTQPEAINNHGDIAGSFEYPVGSPHGFILRNGSFTIIDFPGAVATFIFDINDHGAIAGRYAPDEIQAERGFRMDDKGFISLDPPFTNTAGGTTAFGINNAGDVVGFSVTQEARTFSFLFTRNKFREVSVPGGFDAVAEGINDAQAIVGVYEDIEGFDHGFIGQGGHFSTVESPVFGNAFPFHVNSSGQIVGEYFDQTGNQHSFLAVPGNDDMSETATAANLRRATATPRCTLQALRGHRKEMKKTWLCTVN
jgi:probable HAF family extracellular repeat protein